jgi:hypothetical protein
MLATTNHFAMIIGHPGHELRVFKWVELYKPRVYVLTDGSGVTGTARINSTIQILQACGATVSPIMGYFTDKEIYTLILQNNFGKLLELSTLILDDLEQHHITAVMGDAIEGFNPTHDLCRYLTNSIVTCLQTRTGRCIQNFDFLLDGLAKDGPGIQSVTLTDEDFDRKVAAATAYEELAYELKLAIEKYGREAFKTEYLKQVQPPYNTMPWETDIPFYEKYATEKVKAGKYQEVITYQHHLAPLLHQLQTLV